MAIELGAFSYSVCHSIPFGGRVVVGKYTSIAAGCIMLCGPAALHGSAGTKYVSNFPWKHVDRGEIIIGNDVWIGTNVIILAGVTIGDGAIVGAGCVVSKSIPPYSIVVGNPQRIAKYRFEDEVIAGLLKIRWWDWPAEKIDEERQKPEFNDAAEFVKKHTGQRDENLDAICNAFGEGIDALWIVEAEAAAETA